MFSLSEERFLWACDTIRAEGREENGVGTLSEKSVHAVLKMTCEPYSDSREVRLGGYVADIVGEHGVIEIQTRAFKSMRQKLAAFLPLCPVTIVWPCVETLWIRKVDLETGETFPRRKSPLHQRPADLFRELYSIRDLLSSENLRLKIARIEAEELRSVQTFRAKRRERPLKLDRLPVRLLGEMDFERAEDLLRLLSLPAPPAVFFPKPFTVKELAAAGGLTPDQARLALKCFCAAGMMTEVGKKGNAVLYAALSPLSTPSSGE